MNATVTTAFAAISTGLVLITYVTGLIMATIRLRRLRGAGILVIVGCSLGLAATIGKPVAAAFVSGRLDMTAIYAVHFVASLISVASLALIVAAVFAVRPEKREVIPNEHV